MSNATYSPADVKATLGTILLSGFAEGSMISLKHLGDGVKSYVGTSGEAAFVESANKSAEASVRLMATSLANGLLTTQFQAGNPAVPFSLVSLSTGGVHAAGSAKLKRMPDVDYGADMPVAEWTIVIAQLSDVLTGTP